MVHRLLSLDHEVRTVDIKPREQWWQWHDEAENCFTVDLTSPTSARYFTEGSDWLIDLAEDMGGIGYITRNRVRCARSLQIGMNLLDAAAHCGVQRFFFASSACVYPTHLQTRNGMGGLFELQEIDAWPANPESGYGLSKLYMEELCTYYREDLGLDTRVARFHNVYGPHGTWEGGREKAPAALCRKVAEAVVDGHNRILIWGDGGQIRSYLHVQDCVDGVMALMNADFDIVEDTAFNIGSPISITINDLVTMIEHKAGTTLERTYLFDEPSGVGARSANIDMAKRTLGWHPKIDLSVGMAELYAWVLEQVKAKSAASNGYSANQAPTTAPA